MAQVLPVPVEGDPTHGVQHPEHGQVEGIPGRDVAGTATTGAIAGEAVAEVFLVGHQLGTASIQRTLHQDQGGGVQTQGDRMVHQEVTRANGQEQGVGVVVDGIQPTGSQTARPGQSGQCCQGSTAGCRSRRAALPEAA
jgi:hypothetical protein